MNHTELISYEDVIKQLVADTIDYGSQLGAAGSRFSPGKYPQALFITIKVRAYLSTQCSQMSDVIG